LFFEFIELYEKNFRKSNTESRFSPNEKRQKGFNSQQKWFETERDNSPDTRKTAVFNIIFSSILVALNSRLAGLIDFAGVVKADTEVAADVGDGVEGCVGNGVVLEGVEGDRRHEVTVGDRVGVDGRRGAGAVADHDRVDAVAGVGVGSAFLDHGNYGESVVELSHDSDCDGIAEHPLVGGVVGAAERERDVERALAGRALVVSGVAVIDADVVYFEGDLGLPETLHSEGLRNSEIQGNVADHGLSGEGGICGRGEGVVASDVIRPHDVGHVVGERD
jgi:hypothetical protein